MKKRKQWAILAAALALTMLCGGAALAAGGDETDPLVTLSYLEQIFLPKVTQQAETQAAAKQGELEASLDGKIDSYRTEMEKNIGDTAVEEGSASFELVTIKKGQKLLPAIGCEMLLRVGTATVDCGTNPALIDISTGGTLNKGSSLTKNHLYMATIADRSLVPTADTVKLLVRGGYTVV